MRRKVSATSRSPCLTISDLSFLFWLLYRFLCCLSLNEFLFSCFSPASCCDGEMFVRGWFGVKLLLGWVYDVFQCSIRQGLNAMALNYLPHTSKRILIVLVIIIGRRNITCLCHIFGMSHAICNMHGTRSVVELNNNCRRTVWLLAGVFSLFWLFIGVVLFGS